MLSVYGRRHEGFGVCGHMFNHMADSFVVAIQPGQLTFRIQSEAKLKDDTLGLT